jgi:archaellum component FlaC
MLVYRLIHNYLGIERTDYKARIESLENKITEINENVERITSEYNEFTQTLISEWRKEGRPGRNEVDNAHTIFSETIAISKGKEITVFKYYHYLD